MIQIIDHGSRNFFNLDHTMMMTGNGTIICNGDDNSISINPSCTMAEINMTLGSASSVRIGPDCSLSKLNIFIENAGHVELGKQIEFTWETRIFLHEPGSVTIGNRCLIASDTLIMNSDMHSIIDIATGERVNHAGDIVIGDHVWIGLGARIMKNVRIGSDSIIGMNAVVVSSVENNCLAVGVPARVVRHGVTWDAQLIS